MVRDTFTNRTGENLPLMPAASRAHARAQEGLAGRALAGGTSRFVVRPGQSHQLRRSPRRPASGLIALDDVSQVHVTNFSGEDFRRPGRQPVRAPARGHAHGRMGDPAHRPARLLGHGQRRAPAARRQLHAGRLVRLPAGRSQEAHRPTGATGSSSISSASRTPASSATITSGPATRAASPTARPFRRSIGPTSAARWPGCGVWSPRSQHLLYFHCFIDVLDEAPEKYADARLLRVDGTQADYGEPYDRIFVPTTTNRFGRDIAKNVDLILGPLPQGFGCEGVYWDEFEYSRYQYHYDDFSRPTGLPWDGVSADIDPAQHEDQPAEELGDAHFAALPPGAGPADHAGPRVDRQWPAAHADHDQAALSRGSSRRAASRTAPRRLSIRPSPWAIT